jgi:hypothetical protein
MAGLAGAPVAALGQVGAIIRTVLLPTNFCASGVGTAVAVVPGASVGLPQEPALLVTACARLDGESSAQNLQASKLYFFRPSAVPQAPVLTVTTVQQTEVGAFVFAPPGGWGALALRADKGDLIGCGNRGPFDAHGVYRIALSKSFASSDGAPTTAVNQLFNGQSNASSLICSGLAWDSVENRIYQSGEGSSRVFRFTEFGVMDETTVAVPLGCNPAGVAPNIVGRATGLAVTGGSLFIGCGSTDAEIYRVNKSTGQVLESFGSTNLRSADLGCDPVTFGSQQKDVLWTKGAGDNSLIAVEVQRGSCGGPPPVVAGTLCAKPDGTPDMTDTDGDGLLDCWERPSPLSAGANGQPCIDLDGDGICDLTLCVDSGDGKGTVCANPYRKDVFVEIDWLEGHRPNQAAITRVINKFDIAPVTNPVNPATGTSISGIRLHVLLDDVLRDAAGTMIPHNTGNLFANGLIAFEPYTNVAGAGVLDFDVLKQYNFATAAQRANPKALDAKREVFRYMVFAHLMYGLGGSSGAAEVHGNDGMVTLGAGASILGHAVGSEDQQAGTFMHELGHLLGLRHGGGDFVGCKPNYLSVMSYTRQLPGAPLSATQWNKTGLDYSRSQLPDLDKSNLNEQVGIKPGGIVNEATAFGPGSGVVRSTALGPIDWNRDLSTSVTAYSIPLLNQIISAGSTICSGDGIRPDGTASPNGMKLPGYNDWANLEYDVRSSLDVADGSRLSLLDKEAELGFVAPPGNPCFNAASCPVALTTTDEGLVDSDHDGIPDLMDNCPTIANPLQDNVCAETAVSIDIRPGRYPNTVRLDSIFPLAVAILGGPGFDATQVKPETVRLAGASVIRIGTVYLCGRFDVNHDGFLDFVCVVDKRQLVLPADDAVAVLTAKTRSNVSIRGEDTIHILRGKSYYDDD